jgi:hypothetical protein
MPQHGLQVQYTARNCSAVTGKCFFASFCMSKRISSGVYFSTCPNLRRVCIARAWSCLAREDKVSICVLKRDRGKRPSSICNYLSGYKHRLSEKIGGVLVGALGFEPRASCSQSKRAAGLRYAPKYTALRAAGCEYNAKDDNPSSDKRSTPQNGSADKTACAAAYAFRGTLCVFALKSAGAHASAAFANRLAGPSTDSCTFTISHFHNHTIGVSHSSWSCGRRQT